MPIETITLARLYLLNVRTNCLHTFSFRCFDDIVHLIYNCRYYLPVTHLILLTGEDLESQVSLTE